MASSPPPLLRPPSYTVPVEWGSTLEPQIYILNTPPAKPPPKRANEKARTCAVKFVRGLKNASRRWFTHILLIAVVILYGMLGAVIFNMLENPHEDRTLIDREKLRLSVIADLLEVWENGNDFPSWHSNASERLKAFELELYDLFGQDPEGKDEWTFWGSMFFCGTVYTTIGYGNIAPTTTGGRAVFMLYAIIGIPLLLMVLADLGKLFTRAIKFIFFYIRLFYHTGKCRRARRMGRRATAVPVEYMALALRNMPNPAQLRRKSASHDITPDKQDKVENGVKDKENKYTKLSDEELVSKRPDYDIDDEFNLPVSIAMILLVAYMMLGALIFTLWEEWSFFEAFYFVFVSMSTIGFGDYVPNHPMYMMATFIYLLFGLALTSMCINVVQEKLSEIFEIAKMRIGTTVGFDLRNITAEDYGDEAGTKSQSRRGSKAKPAEEKTKEKSKSPPKTKSPQPKDSSLENVDEIQRDTPSPDLDKGKT